MEIIPAFSMALFAGHIVDQSEKRNLLLKCIGLFSLISFGLFFLTSPSVESDWNTKTILYTIYAFVFMGGLLRAFFGPTIFSLVALIVPKKVYPNAATWNSSTWQMASVLGPAFAGFTINWIGVHWSLCIVFGLVVLSFILLYSRNFPASFSSKQAGWKIPAGSVLTLPAGPAQLETGVPLIYAPPNSKKIRSYSSANCTAALALFTK